MSEDVFKGSLNWSTSDPASRASGETHQARKAMTVRAAAGAVLGLAWGAALRGWMVVLVLQFGERPNFTWKGTFGGILLPAAIMGAMLGVAASAQAPLARKWSRWVILSPLLLVVGPAIATDGFISTLITTGMGGGSIGVALIGLSGGYAVSGFGPRRLRWAAGLLAILLTAASVFGFGLAGAGSSIKPGNVFGALLFLLLMMLLVAGVGASTRSRVTATFLIHA